MHARCVLRLMVGRAGLLHPSRHPASALPRSLAFFGAQFEESRGATPGTEWMLLDPVRFIAVKVRQRPRHRCRCLVLLRCAPKPHGQPKLGRVAHKNSACCPNVASPAAAHAFVPHAPCDPPSWLSLATPPRALSHYSLPPQLRKRNEDAGGGYLAVDVRTRHIYFENTVLAPTASIFPRMALPPAWAAQYSGDALDLKQPPPLTQVVNGSGALLVGGARC